MSRNLLSRRKRRSVSGRGVALLLTALLAAVALAADEAPPGSAQPPVARLLTRWAKDVAPDKVHPEYPRPQLVRDRWLNLNGLWQYAIRPRNAEGAVEYEGEILVPFPVESTLSRVTRFVGPENRLLYRRTFRVPSDWRGQRILLHFGAVDWHTEVRVNGKPAGTHRGGYDPFSFDITDLLEGGEGKPTDHNQELVVDVWDPTDAGGQPRGKQVARPHGIWYTPVTGIWQTVWLEPVPAERIAGLQIEPDIDQRQLVVSVLPTAGAKRSVHLSANQGKWTATGSPGQSIALATPDCELWSPQSPKLYDLTIELRDDDQVLDRVQSYFAMRKIAVGPDANGIPRILLNGAPLFQFGPLDQGWWPDGLYTAPTDEALRYDLEITRQCGFNLVRKHVKVEPARWYYHCDRLGLLVWQDMPSGDANVPWPLDGTEGTRTPGAAAQYGLELQAMIAARRNSPCIVTWVPFNEAWGQFDTVYWSHVVRQLDPSRLVISASGGNDFGVGDVRDIHFYPQPEAPPAEARRAVVLGEYGGLGLPLKGHTWQDERNWGYRQFENRETLQATYLKYIADLRPMVESRLSAAIYTQTTDVEVEVNGVLTYDRAVAKLDPRTIAAVHRTLYAPLRKLSPAERAMAYAIAYWRFEDGVPGQLVAHDRSKPAGMAAADVSGHRNHLYAYSEGNAPRTAGEVPGHRVPALGIENHRALDDSRSGGAVTRDLYTDPGRSKTHMDAINSYPFGEWTVEVSFRLASLGREQTLVGEDGRPTAADEAPLQLGVSADDRLTITAIDRAGQVRTVASRQPLKAGAWYHAAAVGDGRTLQLYLHAGEGYQLQGECEFDEGLILHDGTWTVGRGYHAGAIGRDAQALIDEVRVSTRALPVDWLLWSGSRSITPARP